jgi:hypothetical protein
LPHNTWKSHSIAQISVTVMSWQSSPDSPALEYCPGSLFSSCPVPAVLLSLSCDLSCFAVRTYYLSHWWPGDAVY